MPVLKVKRGEKKALQCISATLQPRITPLLEIVERKPDKAPTVKKHLDTAFRDLAESVSSYSRCFLDAREIASDGTEAAADVFGRASSAGIAFTPVTGISRTADVAAVLDYRTYGVALRLTRDEFERGGLEAGVRTFLSRHGLVPEDVDVIIDLGAVEDLVEDGIARLTSTFMAIQLSALRAPDGVFFHPAVDQM